MTRAFHRRVPFVVAVMATAVASLLAFGWAQDEDWAAVEAAGRAEGALLVYSTTSRTATAAEAFSAMTGIAIEVVRLGEQDLIQRAYQESVAGVNAVDMIVVEDWVAARELLSNTGYFVNYVPPTARALFAERAPGSAGARVHQPHLRLQHRPAPRSRPVRERLGPDHGRVPRSRDDRDVAVTGEHQNAFTEWVRRSDELEAAYERRFGEPLVMTEANAGLEWIKRFLQNEARSS